MSFKYLIAEIYRTICEMNGGHDLRDYQTNMSTKEKLIINQLIDTLIILGDTKLENSKCEN